MPNIEFPQRTAGDVTLPDGTIVWVQTLNAIHHEQANNRAARYAANECRCLLKGGTDYPSLVAQIRGMSVEEQSKFLAQQEFWGIRQEAIGKFPDAMEPERGDDPEAYTKAIAQWEDDRKAVETKREKFFASRHEAEVKRAMALTAKVREERCCTAYHNNEWGTSYSLRLRIETIYRATRRNDDHTQRYFRNAEEFEDADDNVQKTLNDFYFDVLSVKSDDIPTSPASS